MSNDKAEATYHDPGGELPQRTPFETFAQHGQPPSVRVQNTGPATADGSGSFANTGYVGRPEVSPGTPPWDSRVHQDLAVQHGWPTPGKVYPRKSSQVAVWALVLGCVGVLAGWCMFGLPCIAAVVLGHIGLSQTKDDRMSGRGMAVAGLVLGYVALIPAIILAFWFILGSAGAAVHPIPTPSTSF